MQDQDVQRNNSCCKVLCSEICKFTPITISTTWYFWNIIRYIVIGYLIYTANRHNDHNLDDYKKYCCACYAKSKIHHPPRRFDLSYCIPNCADCTYCENNPVYSAHDFTCTVGTYNNTFSSSFKWNWQKATGCTNKHGEYVSILEFFFWVKSYLVYAELALSVTIIYAIFNVVFAVGACVMNDMCDTFSRWVWIYNIFITELCLYLMFKPFQYEQQSYENDIICRVDVISEEIETILTISIVVSLVFVSVHFGWLGGWGLYYICKCIHSCNQNHRARGMSISMRENAQIQQANPGTYILLASSKGKRYRKFACLWGCVSLLVFVAMVFFLILVIMIASMTLKHQSDESQEKLLQKEWIYLVYIFLGASLIDSPWILKQMCKYIVQFYESLDHH